MNTTSDVMLHAWEIHPSVVLGCVILLVWYFVSKPRPAPRRALWFCAGISTLCLSLISPIDSLGDLYLFSAHMLQHLLLILIVPPMLILGLSPAWVAEWMRVPRIAAAEALLAKPSVAWTSNMVMMIVWHVPALYNAANASTAIHISEHLCFLVTACMFWWPIFSPLPDQRLEPGKAMLYLFGAAAVSTVLGIVVTFLPVGLYTPYAHPIDELGALQLIRNGWGISAVEDQRLAGLLMWVPGCSVYFIALLMELARWYSVPGADKVALLATLREAREGVHHG